jgi:ribose 5-phosphate isomerase RpiB
MPYYDELTEQGWKENGALVPPESNPSQVLSLGSENIVLNVEKDIVSLMFTGRFTIAPSKEKIESITKKIRREKRAPFIAESGDC